MHSNSFDEAAGVLPSYIREKALAVLQSTKDSAEEIRLRLGKRPKLFSKGSFFEFSDRIVTQNDLIHLLQIASNASPHRVTENVKNGFISLPGGHRLGICGVVSVSGGQSVNISSLSSACIRIAKQHIGVAAQHINMLTKNGTPLSVLIIAPPGAGKTTYLRDLVRLLSSGASGRAVNIGLADERGEVAAFSSGGFGLDVGENTDVITNCPKAIAITMLLRSMAPGVIAVDEITAAEDTEAIMQAHGWGVKLIATAHAEKFEDLAANKLYSKLLERGVFERVVTVRVQNGVRKYEVTKLDKTAWRNNLGGRNDLGGPRCCPEP